MQRPSFPSGLPRFVLLAGVLGLLGLTAPDAIGGPARFVRYPDIHGDTVVFTWEGDLFSAPAAGGPARRLTTHPGNEEEPKFSPDGKSIAFRASYDGGNDVYVMPAAGGPPKRVTWLGQGERPVAWTPDGKKIVFRSAFESTYRGRPKLYTVSTAGELPEALPIGKAVLCAFSPDGTQIAFNRKGREEYYWKRYKGGQYVDLWLYDTQKKSFSALTDWVGKNAYPMYAGGSFYFVSDRGPKGVANLYRLDLATRKAEAVTSFEDFDVQTPSTDGKRIVFTRAGWLHLFDPATGKVAKIDVDVPSDRWQVAERVVNPKEWVQSMAASNDGKWAALEARGDLFLVSSDETVQPKSLTRTPASRERWARISPDGKKVCFFSDRTGEYQLYLATTAGDSPWEQLTTTLDRTVYHPEWSPDGKKILFGDKDLSLWILDVATKKLEKIATSSQLKNDEFSWEVSDYSWSPDSKWVAYSQVEFNRNNRVFLYSLEQKKAFPLTDGFYDSLNPSFDANGELLYFLQYRNFTARIDVFEDDHVIPRPVQVMAFQLKAGQKPPFLKGAKDVKDGADERDGKEAKEVKEAKDSKDSKGSKGSKEVSASFRIDLDGIGSRLFPAPVPAGNYFHLKAGKGIVTWGSTEEFGEDEIERLFAVDATDRWQLHVFDTASAKEITVEGKVADWRLSPNGEQVVVRKAGAFHLGAVQKLFVSKAPGEKLVLDRLRARVVPAEEWLQVFDDAWRWYRDFFYDAGMHGHDWKAIGAAYRAGVPEISSRSELNWLLSQMVGELCVSHTYVSGGDLGPVRRPETVVSTGFLGAELVADPSGRARFASVFRPSGLTGDLTAPLARPDVDVREGDFLIAVDGAEVQGGANPYRYLQVARGQKVRITVSSKAGGESPRTYEVEPVRGEFQLRYDRWVAGNVDKVLKASGGEIGYLHLTAMGTENIAQFDRFWRAFRYKKGLVIDVRGNGGGWTEYFIIDKLERKLTAFNVLRNMEPFRYPGSTASGPLVVLSNEDNGSDGEAFVEHFKSAKLGTVVGVPSWGGLVGILNGQETVDGGRVEQSNNAFWGEDGKWIVENHGADPDVLVDDDPASSAAGRDVQLEKAIEIVRRQVAEKPFRFAPRPDYPKK